jgi:type IV pilus assembly protein PilW
MRAAFPASLCAAHRSSVSRPWCPINAARPYPSRRPIARRHRGFTLIELMIVILITSVIMILTSGAFLSSKEGFTASDASTQLQDSGRFAMQLLRRLGQQVGYVDLSTDETNTGERTGTSAANFSIPTGTPNCIAADVCGFEQRSATAAQVLAAGDNNPVGLVNTASARANSDTLILRYTGATSPTDASKADGSMIDCLGFPRRAGPNWFADRIISVFYVNTGPAGEPELYCSTRDEAGNFTNQPIIRGVETFQVLYAVDTDVGVDNVPNRYMRAGEITTLTQWQRVRAIRVGMVIRGPVGTGAFPAGTTLFPLGQDAATAGDPGSTFTVPNDGRLRRVVNFTIQVRNDLNRAS